MFLIRPAEKTELPAILDLQRLCYQSEAELYQDWHIPPLTQTIDEMTEEFRRATFLVACDGPQVIGSVRGEVRDQRGHIGRLIVHPDWQGRGIGRQLMRAIEASIAPVSHFRVFTGDRSVANIRHYESHGYRQIDTKAVSDKVRIVIMEKAAAR